MRMQTAAKLSLLCRAVIRQMLFVSKWSLSVAKTQNGWRDGLLCLDLIHDFDVNSLPCHGLSPASGNTNWSRRHDSLIHTGQSVHGRRTFRQLPGRSADATRRGADGSQCDRSPHIEFCPPSGRLAVKCGIGRRLLAVNAERPRAPEDGACGTGSREDTSPHFLGCNENCGLADKLLRSVTRRRRCT